MTLLAVDTSDELLITQILLDAVHLHHSSYDDCQRHQHREEVVQPLNVGVVLRAHHQPLLVERKAAAQQVEALLSVLELVANHSCV